MNKAKEIVKKSYSFRVPIVGEIALSISRTVFAIMLGLVASAILIAICGVNPISAYWYMLQGAFGNFASFTNVLIRTSPLLLGGMGVAFGIKAGVWNTGIEGYMYLGAIGAAVVGIPDFGLPKILHILIVFIVAMLFAALWGLIPGILRAYQGVNEVTCTIMMNYIAIYLTSWFVSEPQPLAEAGAFYPMSKLFSESAMLPILAKGTSFHPGVFIGLIICLVFFFILNYTSFGFRTRMLGQNPHASRYAGVNAKKQIVIAMLIGAALGGLAGAIEVTGLKSRVYMDFVTGVGYESVAVALVAGGNPIGVIVAAIFLSVLKVGGSTMSIMTGLPSSMADIIIALCVLFVIGVGVADSRRANKKIDKNDKEEENEKLEVTAKEEVTNNVL